MPAILRYQYPVVMRHLANQYVAGVMSPLARRRMEKLLLRYPELNRTVALAADQVADIHYQLPAQETPDYIWPRIEHRVGKSTTGKVNNSWLQSLWWKLTGFSSLAVSLALAILFFQQQAIEPFVPANYAAAMSIANSEDDVRFLILAYGKTERNPSKLVVQWSERHPRKQTQPLHLWAESLDTQQLTYLGTEPTLGDPWYLSKHEWQAVKQSGRLLMTITTESPSADNLAFQGRCVQLKPWKSNS